MLKQLWSPNLYRQAYQFAAQAHIGQTVPGTEISYLMHLSFVTMETMTALCQDPPKENPDLAVQCALLHDVIEDTETTYEDVQRQFGTAVADGVLALTKDSALSTKAEKMQDSLQRLLHQPREVQMVKLADRITNLAPPPLHWEDEKRRNYQQEARMIYSVLHPASRSLAERLTMKIKEYDQYLEHKEKNSE